MADNFDPKEFYDKAIAAVDKDRIKEIHKKHSKGAAVAYEHIKEKSAETKQEGLEILTDAFIKYQKEAGMPVSDDAEDRHRYFSEVEQILDHHYKDKPKELIKDFKEGNLKSVLDKLIAGMPEQDAESEMNYKLRKEIPDDLDYDQTEALAKHINKEEKLGLGKGDVVQLAQPRALRGQLGVSAMREYQKKLHNKDYKKAA